HRAQGGAGLEHVDGGRRSRGGRHHHRGPRRRLRRPGHQVGGFGARHRVQLRYARHLQAGLDETDAASTERRPPPAAALSSLGIVLDWPSETRTHERGAAMRRQGVAGAGGFRQTAVPVTLGLNYSQSLRFMNTTALEVTNQLVRVMSSSCTTNCGPDDVYRLRAFETTESIPRFNNSGSQLTVLLLQNPSGYTITGNIYFWATNGTLSGPPFP